MKIEICNATKSIKNNLILDNISCVLESGKRYGIVGRNGSGKTMLLRAICGFLKLDSGCICVDGNEVGSGRNEFISNTGAIIGDVVLYDSLSGLDNLRLLAEIKKEINDEIIIDTLKKVGLYEAMDKKYAKYSMGMKQRLKIAQAIMENNNILILDEPFNGLDKQGVASIQKVIDDYVCDNKLLILTSHHEAEINNLCNVIIEMDGGKIIDEKQI